MRQEIKIMVINGPSLNFLGIRNPEVYGKEDYDSLIQMIQDHAKVLDVFVDCFQSNHEGAIIDCLQDCYHKKFDGVIINPGAFTHYSYAIRDAIESVKLPTVEIHISNIYEREPFRQNSVVRPVCVETFYGEGLAGYLKAMDHLVAHFRGPEKNRGFQTSFY